MDREKLLRARAILSSTHLMLEGWTPTPEAAPALLPQPKRQRTEAPLSQASSSGSSGGAAQTFDVMPPTVNLLYQMSTGAMPPSLDLLREASDQYHATAGGNSKSEIGREEAGVLDSFVKDMEANDGKLEDVITSLIDEMKDSSDVFPSDWPGFENAVPQIAESTSSSSSSSSSSTGRVYRGRKAPMMHPGAFQRPQPRAPRTPRASTVNGPPSSEVAKSDEATAAKRRARQRWLRAKVKLTASARLWRAGRRSGKW